MWFTCTRKLLALNRSGQNQVRAAGFCSLSTTAGASWLNFLGVAKKCTGLMGVSGSLVAPSVAWGKVMCCSVDYSGKPNCFFLGRQGLGTPKAMYQHCSTLYCDPNLDATRLYTSTFCCQCKVVDMYANLFPTYQIWLQEATIVLTLLVFTSCSNSMLVLVLLEKFKCP